MPNKDTEDKLITIDKKQPSQAVLLLEGLALHANTFINKISVVNVHSTGHFVISFPDEFPLEKVNAIEEYIAKGSKKKYFVETTEGWFYFEASSNEEAVIKTGSKISYTPMVNMTDLQMYDPIEEEWCHIENLDKTPDEFDNPMTNPEGE